MGKPKWSKELVLQCVREDKLPSELDNQQELSPLENLKRRAQEAIKNGLRIKQ